MTIAVAVLLFVATMWFCHRYEDTRNIADIAVAAACAVTIAAVAIVGASR